jgi:hypothetical protein
MIGLPACKKSLVVGTGKRKKPPPLHLKSRKVNELSQFL